MRSLSALLEHAEATGTSLKQAIGFTFYIQRGADRKLNLTRTELHVEYTVEYSSRIHMYCTLLYMCSAKEQSRTKKSKDVRVRENEQNQSILTFREGEQY